MSGIIVRFVLGLAFDFLEIIGIRLLQFASFIQGGVHKFRLLCYNASMNRVLRGGVQFPTGGRVREPLLAADPV